MDKSRAVVEIVDMTDGRVVHKQRQQFVGTNVDDEGRFAWSTLNLVRSYATTSKGAAKDVGRGEQLGWAPGGRVLTYDSMKAMRSPPGKLGDVACKLVTVTRIGS